MTAPLSYVPYQDLEGRPSIIVDGSAAEGTVLTLSHWPKSPCPPGLERDLSAEMAFAYLDVMDLHGHAEAVSNNHFDQDGLVSLFALLHPDPAQARRQLLIDVARAGDFATYTNRTAARASMAISAYADPERSPLGPGNGNYEEWSSGLYEEFLDRLIDVCERTDRYSDVWATEDASLTASEEAISAGRIQFDEDPELDLVVVRVPVDAPKSGGHLFAGQWRKGLHPMALHNATKMFTLLVVTGASYELYYRYESWVQYRTSRPKARVDLAPLADELNSMEDGSVRWKADKPSALTPGLRLIPTEGSDAPAEATSAIDSDVSPERFIEIAKAHLAAAPPAWDPYAATTADT